jgi:peroxiredoxin
MSQLPIGKQAPDFELRDLRGEIHRLSNALASGSMVLAFYKSTCSTSQFTYPHLQKISSEGRRIWGISQDDEAETRRFAEQFGIHFNLLIDEHPYDVSSAYGLEFVPGIFLIEQDRSISVSDFGFAKSTLNEIAGFEMFKPGDGLPATIPG